MEKVNWDLVYKNVRSEAERLSKLSEMNKETLIVYNKLKIEDCEKWAFFRGTMLGLVISAGIITLIILCCI